mmetsp:Transcript_53327/g.165659  ORF Transcript_53327/g.165659 Transcript_53327/m.165659 type:complete len:243 (-) Transcript_53327:718-1446(-)
MPAVEARGEPEVLLVLLRVPAEEGRRQRPDHVVRDELLVSGHVLQPLLERLHLLVLLGNHQHRHLFAGLEGEGGDLVHLLLLAPADQRGPAERRVPHAAGGPLRHVVQLPLRLAVLLEDLASLQEGRHDEEVRAVGLRQELLLHPVADRPREPDDAAVQLEHPGNGHDVEALVPAHLGLLLVHEAQDLEEVRLVVLVHPAVLVRAVPVAELVLVPVVGARLPRLHLLHELRQVAEQGRGRRV